MILQFLVFISMNPKASKTLKASLLKIQKERVFDGKVLATWLPKEVSRYFLTQGVIHKMIISILLKITELYQRHTVHQVKITLPKEIF